MAGKKVQNQLKRERNKNYLSRDFDSFRNDLLRYARTYFPDKISDFSEASLGGLFLDMASYVGDTLSFYLDHQYGELDPLRAVESENIQKHLENAGVPITGASPAVLDAQVFIEVPATSSSDNSSNVKPISDSLLPTIKAGTIFRSTSGVKFYLTEDVNFGDRDKSGNLVAKIEKVVRDRSGSPITLILSRGGNKDDQLICLSGNEITESFQFGNNATPFQKITLSNPSVSDIVSVTDSDGNTYYEVESLAQDVVFRSILNTGDDSDLVESNLEMIPAPYRFIKKMSVQSRLTTIQFGSGDAASLDDDVIPDPSDVALPLYGKKVFSRFSIDPNNLLDTQTLGISPKNTTVSVTYRYGGGSQHNVGAGSVRTVDTLVVAFENKGRDTDQAIINQRGGFNSLSRFVRRTVDVSNPQPASGGSRAPTIQELRERIPQSRTMQSRIVSKQDLLARAYSLPSKFGRIYRAGIRTNSDNPLAAELYIASLDKKERLAHANDSLKLNLRTYLNEFRLISDAIEILDARIINYAVKFEVISSPGLNKETVIREIILRLKRLLSVKNFQIDQPIVLDDITNVIINTPGVISISRLKLENLSGNVSGRSYSDERFAFDNASDSFGGIISGPPGSIFELRYGNYDIYGSSR